jgi:hypothetical protein
LTTRSQPNRNPEEISMEPVSSLRLRIGRALSALAALFLSVDALGKLLRLAPVVSGSVELGYPERLVLPIGLLLLAGVVLYVVPRTSLLGAIYLTAYLGGAVATHVRVGSPLLSHVLFPTYVAAFVWGGLVLRNPALLSALGTTAVVCRRCTELAEEDPPAEPRPATRLLPPLAQQLEERHRPSAVEAVLTASLARLSLVVVVARRALLEEALAEAREPDDRVHPLLLGRFRDLDPADVAIQGVPDDVGDVLALLAEHVRS